MHSGAYFQDVMEYLRSLLDGEGALLDNAHREKWRTAFSRTLQLEKAFFMIITQTNRISKNIIFLRQGRFLCADARRLEESRREYRCFSFITL